MQFQDLNWAQQAAQTNIAAALSGGVKRLFVDMPTGTGKTGVFLNMLDQLNRQSALPPTIIMAPTTIITDNNFAEAAKFAPSLVGSNKIARFTLGDLGDHSARAVPVKVMTYSSGVEALREDLIRTPLIIPDEGHHALSKRRQEILSSLPYESRQIAFTASPEYSREKNLAVAGYTQAYHLGLREAVEGHILSDIRNIMVEMAEFAGILDNLALVKGDYDPDELEKVLMDNRLLDAAIKFYGEGRNLVEKKPVFGSTGLASCNSIAHSVAFANRFNAAFPLGAFGDGVVGCQPIWGDMTESLKKKLIEQHRSGEVMLLACKDVLITGYDNPRISLVMNLRPTMSGVVAEQRGGRAVRYDHSNPEKEALVADFVLPSRRNQQLLYGDVVGGYVFQKSQDSKAMPSNLDYLDHPPVNGHDVHYSEKQIFSFLKTRDIQAELGRNAHLAAYSPTIAWTMAAKGLTTQDAIMSAVNRFLFNSSLDHDPRYKTAATKGQIIGVLKGEKSPFKKAFIGSEKNAQTVKAYNLTALVISGVLKTPVQKLFGPLPENALPDISGDFVGPDPDHIFDNDFDHIIDGIEERAKNIATPEEVEEALERDMEERVADPDTGWTEINGQIVLANDLEEHIDKVQLRLRVNRAFQTLTPKQERIVRARLGINVEEQTLEEVAQTFSVTKERIRSLEGQALRKLGAPVLQMVISGTTKTPWEGLQDAMEAHISAYVALDKIISENDYRSNHRERMLSEILPGQETLLRSYWGKKVQKVFVGTDARDYFGKVAQKLAAKLGHNFSSLVQMETQAQTPRGYRYD